MRNEKWEMGKNEWVRGRWGEGEKERAKANMPLVYSNSPAL